MSRNFVLKANQSSEIDHIPDPEFKADPEKPEEKAKAVAVPREVEVSIDADDFVAALKGGIPWLNQPQVHVVEKDERTGKKKVKRSAALHPRSGPFHKQSRRVWCTILPDHEGHPGIAFVVNGLLITEELKDVFRGIMTAAIEGSGFTILGDRMGPQGHSMYFDLSPRAGASLVQSCDNFRAGCQNPEHEDVINCGCGWYTDARARLRLPEGWQ